MQKPVHSAVNVTCYAYKQILHILSRIKDQEPLTRNQESEIRVRISRLVSRSVPPLIRAFSDVEKPLIIFHNVVKLMRVWSLHPRSALSHTCRTVWMNCFFIVQSLSKMNWPLFIHANKGCGSSPSVLHMSWLSITLIIIYFLILHCISRHEPAWITVYFVEGYVQVTACCSFLWLVHTIFTRNISQWTCNV